MTRVQIGVTITFENGDLLARTFDRFSDLSAFLEGVPTLFASRDDEFMAIRLHDFVDDQLQDPIPGLALERQQ